MKSLKVYVVLFFIVAFIAACSAGHDKELTGVWQKEGGAGTIEFTGDGLLKLTGGPATVSAPFKAKDKETLQVDLGILGTSTFKYALAKDTLTITDAKGTSVKYTKPKAQTAAKAQPEPAKAAAAPAAAPAKGH